jgi:CRISPR-associated protein Csx14
MAVASIPVDLFNPGQVFACLGFLEAADALLGDAESGFDWSDEADIRYELRAAWGDDPFAVVLRFLAEADVVRLAPIGYADPPPKKKSAAFEDDADNQEDAAGEQNLRLSETFPGREGDRMALPVRLESLDRLPIDLGHWADGSRRNEFKLYAGNRSAYGIARAMLRGTRKKPTKSKPVGDLLTQGIDALWSRRRAELIADPFGVLTLMGGSFNFDPRGAWTALDAGYSPNQHKHHGIAASPVVEILAAWGLEHARPDEYDTRKVRYGAWGGLIPPMLARPAVAGSSVPVPLRRFQFVLDLSGKNKVVTFAHEETSA